MSKLIGQNVVRGGGVWMQLWGWIVVCCYVGCSIQMKGQWQWLEVIYVLWFWFQFGIYIGTLVNYLSVNMWDLVVGARRFPKF